MSFVRHIETRFARTMHALGLPPAAGRVLHALILLDLEGTDKADVHGRQGIISWHRMAEEVTEGEVSVGDMERAVVVLADWGLVQIVGRTPSDPKLAGASALRLTHAGRVCTGLAPQLAAAAAPEAEASSWLVIHHANREGLILHAQELVGDVAWRPISPPGDRNATDLLCGQLAASMVTHGAAVLDGFPLSEAERARDLPEVLWRTRNARAARILLLPEPTPVRVVAASIGARMAWVEPVLDSRREGNATFDRRVTDQLQFPEDTRGVAHACGVPPSSLARPKRVDVRWDDLILPESVKTQVEQAMMHAQFRLNELPSRGGFIGKGSGYRLLLSGLPGTGKSLMAEALATKLDRTIIKLDLSSVLSKWLGETEQLIGQIFDLAEASNSVLVLDEAEALFRQRQSGGGGGSNAMLTAVAYLLTRLDRFEGVLVGTTNRTQDIDDALFRRFDDFIILPVPDHDTRVRLWQKMLGDGLGGLDHFSEPDFDHLGRYFVITGGLIRGAAIRANAWAAGEGRAIAMPYVLASLARELEKSDHPTTGVLVEPYRTEVARLLNDKKYTASA